MGNEVVHEVLPNGLRLLIEHVSLVLLDLFESLLGVDLLLLADLPLDNLLSIERLLSLELFLVRKDFLFSHVHLLVLLIERHVVERLLKALYVDLQTLQHLLLWGCNTVKLLVDINTLLLEKLLKRRLSYC